MKKDNLFTHKFLPILGLMFFILFILCINTNVNAASTADLSTLTDVQKDSIKKCWSSAVDYCNNNSINIKDCYYFVTYSYNNSPGFASVYIINKSKTTLRELSFENASGKTDWFNYFIGFNCFDNQSTNCWYNGFNSGNYIRNPGDTRNPMVIANNVYTTNNAYKQISRSIEDVYFIDNPFNDGYKYSIELSTNEKTEGPIVAYSNYFNIDDYKYYECYISSDNAQTFNLMNYETYQDSDGNNFFRFNYRIISNGDYYFKFINTETSEEYYLTYQISNIIKTSHNSGFSSSGIPQPFCTYERVNDEFIIKTQNFTLDDLQKYDCLYINGFNEDMSSWNKMSMGTYYNSELNQTEYYFFFTVPTNSENCTYYFVFYDRTLNEYGAYSCMDCNFEVMNEYCDKVSGVTEEKKSKLDELREFFQQRFGFLTYPFEFIINLFNKILNINYSEPILHFPQINNPINDEVIFEGFDYNFNSILEYEGVSYFYNIYLCVVDALFIFAFVKGCKNTLEEVIGNG